MVKGILQSQISTTMFQCEMTIGSYLDVYLQSPNLTKIFFLAQVGLCLLDYVVNFRLSLVA
jgi:hypothetical protein